MKKRMKTGSGGLKKIRSKQGKRGDSQGKGSLRPRDRALLATRYSTVQAFPGSSRNARSEPHLSQGECPTSAALPMPGLSLKSARTGSRPRGCSPPFGLFSCVRTGSGQGTVTHGREPGPPDVRRPDIRRSEAVDEARRASRPPPGMRVSGGIPPPAAMTTGHIPVPGTPDMCSLPRA